MLRAKNIFANEKVFRTNTLKGIKHVYFPLGFGVTSQDKYKSLDLKKSYDSYWILKSWFQVRLKFTADKMSFTF